MTHSFFNISFEQRISITWKIMFQRLFLSIEGLIQFHFRPILLLFLCSQIQILVKSALLNLYLKRERKSINLFIKNIQSYLFSMLQRTQSQQSCSSLSSFINARFTFNATSSQICQRLEDFIKEYMKQFGKIKEQGGEWSGIKQKLGDIQKNGNDDSIESGEVNEACNQVVKYVCQLLMALNKSEEHEEDMSQVSQKKRQKLKDFINAILQKLRLELQIQAIENGQQNQGEIFKQIINKIIITRHRKMNIFEELLLENGYISQEEYVDIVQKYGFDKTKKKQQKINHIEKNTRNNDLNKNHSLMNYFQRNIGKFDQLLVENQKTLKKQELNSMMPLKQKQIQKSRTIYHSRKSVHMVKKSSSSRQYFCSYGTYNSFDKLESFDNSTQWSSTQNSQNYDSLNSKGKNESYFKSKSAKNFNEIENRQREEDQSFLVAVTPKLRPSFSKIDASREKRINFVLQF